MQEDEEGFLYPVLDTKKCVECGLCELTCPMSSDKRRENVWGGQKAFLMTGNKKDNYYLSATAGVCTVLARMVVSLGGVVYGVQLNENEWKAKHICVKDNEGVEQIRNSKYLQSDTNDTFAKVKSELSKGVYVLYVGTPCQISGLKSFLRKEYENLLTVDLICHGVYSYKLIREEVKYWENYFQGKIKNFRFRSKRIYPHPKGGIVNFDVIRAKKQKHIEILAPYSPTYRCYAYSGDGLNHNLRYSCYTCSFRDRQRYGDFTVGDPWKVKLEDVSINTTENSRNGISLVICNTPKAISLLSELKQDFSIEEIPIEKAFKQEALIKCDREIPFSRNTIYSQLGEKTYEEIVDEALSIDIKALYKEYLFHEKLIVKVLMKIGKKIKAYKNGCSNYKREFSIWFMNTIISNFPSRRLRYWYLKRMGMDLAPNVRFYAGFHIRNPRGVIIEDGVNIGPHVLLDGRLGLKIGKSAVIAYDAIIWTMNHDYNDIDFKTKGGAVSIGAYSWICSRSIILPGITVGEGAVVASGAIVTRDVPPFSVVAGIPAKVVGYREKKDYRYAYASKTDKNHCW